MKKDNLKELDTFQYDLCFECYKCDDHDELIDRAILKMTHDLLKHYEYVIDSIDSFQRF